MAWCYNGCAPSYTSCNHNAVRNKYKAATETLLSELGWDYWYTPVAPTQPTQPTPVVVPLDDTTMGGRVISNADGRLEVFARGGDGAVWHAYQSAPNNPFVGWDSLHGTTTSDPVVGRNADGRLEVFAIGTDGALLQRWQTGPTSWSDDWMVSGALSLAGTPAVISNADGRLEVFARTNNGVLAHRWQLVPNGGWSQWETVDALTVAVTDGPTLARNADGRIEVFTRGDDGAAWHVWQDSPNGAFSGVSSLGGSITGAPRSTRDGQGQLVVFARGVLGPLYWRAQNASGWSDWSEVAGGAVDAEPEVAVNSDGRVEVFVRRGNVMMQTWEWSPGAHDFGALGTLGGDVAATSNGSTSASVGRSIDGRLELFTRAADGSVAHVWQLPDGGGWSAWGSLGGWVSSF
jgi:hypothetical protein